MNLKKKRIGILGGSFDPAHNGHLAISKEAVKRFKLEKIIWAITKKNPFKKKSSLSLQSRIKGCKKIIKKNKHLDFIYTHGFGSVSYTHLTLPTNREV